MSVVSARLRAARTMFSPSAKRCRGENHAAAVRIPAAATKRRRERQCEWLAISSSYDICFFFERSGGVVALQVKACAEDMPPAYPAVVDRRCRNRNRLEACLPDRPEARFPVFLLANSNCDNVPSLECLTTFCAIANWTPSLSWLRASSKNI